MNPQLVPHPPAKPAPVNAGRLDGGAFYGTKIRIPSSSMHFHAWYRADGTLSDAQGWDRLRRCRPVKQYSTAWYELEARSDTIRDLASRTEADHGADLIDRMAESLRDCVRDLNIAIEYSGRMGNPEALRKSVHKANALLAEYGKSRSPADDDSNTVTA